MADVLIGTSGWNYPEWSAGFYAGIPRKDWLRRYASVFDAVEVNATFYGGQKPATFARWRDETPIHFRFAIKGHRIVTHLKRLKGVAEAVSIQRASVAPLAGRLAAVLWQLPANYHRDVPRLREFLAALGEVWADVRHAVEFRHPSWFIEEVAEALAACRVAVCQSDAADWPLWDRVTTDLVYVRLHGHTRTYASAYSSTGLQRWAARVLDWSRRGYSVHVYFDNDAEGAAPRDALRLIDLLDQAPGARLP